MRSSFVIFWLRRWPLQGPWKAIVLKSIATIDELQGGNPGKIPPWKNEGWIKPLPVLFKTGGSGIGAPDFGTAIFSFFSTFFSFQSNVYQETGFLWFVPCFFFSHLLICGCPEKSSLNESSVTSIGKKNAKLLDETSTGEKKAPGIVKELNGVRFWGASLLFLGNWDEGWILHIIYVYMYTYIYIFIYIQYIQIKKHAHYL